MQRTVIFGAGGFGVQILDILDLIGGDIVFADDSKSGDFYGFPIIGSADIAPVDAIGIAIASGRARKSIADRFPQNPTADLTAATAIVASRASIGNGAIICDGAIIETATIGKQFQANVMCHVAHECVIGDYVTLAPRVSCNGAVKIGNHAYIGAGAVIKQGLTIGEGAIIGMGTVVTKNVPAGATVYGNPAHQLITP